jgi:hypothetical protein
VKVGADAPLVMRCSATAGTMLDIASTMNGLYRQGWCARANYSQTRFDHPFLEVGHL